MKIILDIQPSELLKLVTDHQLYNEGGDLLGAIKAAIKTNSPRTRSALASIDSKPVGVCFLKSSNWLQVFVKPEYRHQGIGHQLVDVVLKSIGRRRLFVWAAPGEHEELSIKFWQRHQVLVDENGSIPMSTQQFEDLQAGRIDVVHLNRMHLLKRRLEVNYISKEEYDQQVAIETNRTSKRYERFLNELQQARNPEDPSTQAAASEHPDGSPAESAQ